MNHNRLNIAEVQAKHGLILAPMEGVTDLPFRVMCRKLGAEYVYTEFIASEALVRNIKKSMLKMRIHDIERPVAIQIFGSNIENMALSAKIVEEAEPEIIDLNYGCWVKKVVRHGAGAAMLKDLDKMYEMTRAVVDAVSTPVTVKTRIGWDKDNIVIEEARKAVEAAGAKALAIHCRTREMGMKGDADWSWVKKVKENANIPIILNGDIRTPQDVKLAYEQTNADGVMIGRGAVGNPFLFWRTVKLLEQGADPGEPDADIRIKYCLEHLGHSIEFKGFPRGMYEFRKYYTGYLRGLHMASQMRQKLVVSEDPDEIRKTLLEYLDYLVKEDRLQPAQSSIVRPRESLFE